MLKKNSRSRLEKRDDEKNSRSRLEKRDFHANFSLYSSANYLETGSNVQARSIHSGAYNYIKYIPGSITCMHLVISLHINIFGNLLTLNMAQPWIVNKNVCF